MRLVDNLREVELVIGDRARPVVAEVRSSLLEALANRRKGDSRTAMALIGRAMERSAALANQLDAEEGGAMRAIVERFMVALVAGDKGTAKETINFMRHKAGDVKDGENTDW